MICLNYTLYTMIKSFQSHYKYKYNFQVHIIAWPQ